MNGHHPVMDLISDGEWEQWPVSCENNNMLWKSQMEGNDMVMTFKRIHLFPGE